MYDFLIVGAGLFGSVFAYEASLAGKRCLVIDKRNHVGGNLFCESIEGITVHKYGPHIFHTDNKTVWEYVNRFAEFNRFTNAPLVDYEGELYNLPVNMNTFYKLWGVKEPEVARHLIEKQRALSCITAPKNLEQQAIFHSGEDVYNKLIRGYMEKLWGRNCTDLPPHFLSDFPLLFTFDNSFYNDRFQGVCYGGYNQIFEKLLEHCDVKLGADFFSDAERYKHISDRIVYTGRIDEFYGCRYGELNFRSLSYETEVLGIANFKGNAITNFSSPHIPYTRIIEHKHLEFGMQDKTVVSYEYSDDCSLEREPGYCLNDDENAALYAKYQALAEKERNVIFGGRLGTYRNIEMWQAVGEALMCADLVLS